jgi:xenotropic and polytropic retrovirus receptor 1
LYAHHWNNPPQCNSAHSRLLGFFSTLPGIWRALQCIRRYKDTRNIFPHLINCGKYFATILYYVTLSVYRIDRTWTHLAVFITFATINAIYTCKTFLTISGQAAKLATAIWDLVMDWSLMQPHASKRFLRDVRGYKSARWYYLAMILDPILRFNWIFYAIYTQDLQHSTIVSFLVALSEVSRRGMWVLFRVENEHCSNVARFKASRDVPLPYNIPTESEEDFERRQQAEDGALGATTTSASSPAAARLRSHTGATLEAQESAGSSLRRRPTRPRTFTMILADAHTQDFEKKKKPGAGDSDNVNNVERDGDPDDDGQAGSSDEDDDEQDTQDVLDAEALLRERREQTGDASRQDD